MQSFREFVDQIQELSEDELHELYGRPPAPPPSGPSSPVNRREAHKKIDESWHKFLKDAEKFGYVVPKGEGLKTMIMHNTLFSPNDVGGRYTLTFPSSLVKRLNI